MTRVNPRAEVLALHELAVGDVIFAIGGVEKDATDDCMLHLRLNVTAGDSVPVGLIRAGARQQTTVRTHRQYYRKAVVQASK